MIRSARTALPAALMLLSVSLFSPAPQPLFAADPAGPPDQKAAAEAAPAELPLTRAVLFSSGVAYFEHSGVIEDTAKIRLQFKTDQINDVLKSMVINDEGGNLASVTYPSNDPIERSLRSFGVNLNGNPSLPQLLTQLRGAQVIVTTPEKISGAILSVEAQTKVSPGPTPMQTTEYVIALATESGIRSFPLASVSKIEFADPKIQDEMNKALALLVSSRDTDRKPVDIRFEGKGKRTVRVGYLVESPVWKTSYRLDLSGEKPLLQGWAIVENTSDNDWNKVQLGLVSGRPISFIMDLYTPLYLQRPTVVQEQYAFLRPQVYEEGIEDEKKEALADEAGADKDMTFGAKAAMAKGSDRLEMQSRRALMSNGAALAMDGVPAERARLREGAAMAMGGGVGELFEFNLKDPVNIARRKSSMLPIINQAITAEKVSIYNQSVMADRPLNGVLITNNTGLKMPAGPITVFDGDSYAGDAQIDNIGPDDKRLLSYAVDLSVTVDAGVAVAQQFMAAKIVKGVLYITRKNTFTQTYTFKNKGKTDRTIIVEHPFINGRELLEPAKFEEKTPTSYRFRLPVGAGKTESLAVKEQQPFGETIALIQYPAQTLLSYSNSGEIDKAVRDALAKVAAAKQELVDRQQHQQDLRNQIAQITTEQERLRQNINTAGKDSSLGKRYLDKLNSQEDTIDQLQKQIIDLQTQIDSKTKELNDLVMNLNVG